MVDNYSLEESIKDYVDDAINDLRAELETEETEMLVEIEHINNRIDDIENTIETIKNKIKEVD